MSVCVCVCMTGQIKLFIVSCDNEKKDLNGSQNNLIVQYNDLQILL